MRLEAVGIYNILTNEVDSWGDVRLFFHVNFHVLLEAGFHSKALPTVDTDVRVEVLVDLKVLVKIGYAAKDLPALVALQAVSFMYDHPVLRLHCQLPAVIRLHFNHVLTFRLKQHLSQQGLARFRLDFCRCETVHVSMLHLDIVMVCLGNDCIHTCDGPELSPEPLDLQV